jgi:hypothetical protein
MPKIETMMNVLIRTSIGQNAVLHLVPRRMNVHSHVLSSVIFAVFPLGAKVPKSNDVVLITCSGHSAIHGIRAGLNLSHSFVQNSTKNDRLFKGKAGTPPPPFAFFLFVVEVL